jgi:hypothetical protein
MTMTKDPPMEATPPKPTVSRAMWIVFGSVFAVVALAYGTYTVVGLVAYAHNSTHVEFTGAEAAAVTKVEVHSDAGSVHITGTDEDRIVVDGDVTYGLQKPRNETHIEGDTLIVRSSCSAFSNTWCNVNYTISVPAHLAVVVRGEGGVVRIERVDGPIDASASGGGVRVVDVGGDLRLDSSGGGVRGEQLRSDVVGADSSGGGVRLSFVEPPTSVRADSSGGGVTVEVPRPDAYNIDADSSGGGVDVSDVAHDPRSGRVIIVDSSGGGVTVRYLPD